LVRLKPWELRERGLPLDSVQLVKLFLDDSKTDQFGLRGRSLLVSAKKGEVERTLVGVLYRWSLISGIREGDPFLSRLKATKVCRDSRACLQRKSLVDELKRVARFFGLDEVFFSSHCFRIGGATTMASAGAPRDRIKRIADWLSSSDCDLIYEQFNGLDGGVLSIVDESGPLSESETLERLYGKILSSRDVFFMQPISRPSVGSHATALGPMIPPAKVSNPKRPSHLVTEVARTASSSLQNAGVPKAKRSKLQGTESLVGITLPRPAYV
jgi:hypothetical protein